MSFRIAHVDGRRNIAEAPLHIASAPKRGTVRHPAGQGEGPRGLHGRGRRFGSLWGHLQSLFANLQKAIWDISPGEGAWGSSNPQETGPGPGKGCVVSRWVRLMDRFVVGPPADGVVPRAGVASSPRAGLEIATRCCRGATESESLEHRSWIGDEASFVDSISEQTFLG